MSFIHSFFVRQPAPYPKVGSLDAHRGGEPQLTSQQRPASAQCRGRRQCETSVGPTAQHTGEANPKPEGKARHAPTAATLRPAVAKTDWVFTRRPRGGTRGTKPKGSRAVAGEHHDMRSSPTAGLSVAWRGPAASVGQRQRQMGHHKASEKGETSGTKPKEARAKAGEHHDVRSSPMAVLSISWKGPVASCWARTAALPQSTAES